MGLTHIQQQAPLVHCITNIVVANFQANGLLTVGASPVMADAPEEVEHMSALAQATSLNIGTLNQSSVKAMLLAGQAANKKNTPVVLDPVGVGATPFRKQATQQLMQELRLAVLRCNVGELAAIADVPWQSRGVDSGDGQLAVEQVARQVAQQYNCIVAVTDAVDCVTDGHSVIRISGGAQLTPQITGSGCLLSALVAAGLVGHTSFLKATVAVFKAYKKAAERAAQKASYMGSYQVAFLDALHQLALGE